MKNINLNEFKNFNNGIFKYFIICFALFIITTVITVVILQNDLQHTNNFMKNFGANTLSSDKPAWMVFLYLFFSNLIACIVTIIFGRIPFLFTPLFTTIRNGYVLGMVIIACKLFKKNVLLVLLLGVLPHGIFEIPAVIYVCGIGTYLCRNTTLSLIRKNPYENNIKVIKKIFVNIIIPLLLIAAFIESFITPKLLQFVH